MNDKQKQQAMVKLAQVRLAINYALRKRAMLKFAQAQQWNPDYFDRWGYRNWSGWWNGAPRYRPGSAAERDPYIWNRDTFDRITGTGRYARPNTGTPRVGDSANGQSVNRQGNPNSR